MLHRSRIQHLGNIIEGDFQDSWNKKRVIAGILIVGVVVAGIIGVKKYFLDASPTPKNMVNSQNQAVMGEQAQNSSGSNTDSSDNTNIPGSIGTSTVSISPTLDAQQQIQQKIDQLKSEINNLNTADVLQNSAPVQKIQSDMKSLEQYPGNQAKDFCQQICGSL